MPLHEYECDVCGHRFEKIQKFSDPPIEVCPICGGHVHKLISSPAFQFKGSGWYVTDYAKKDTTGTDKAESVKTGGDSKETTAAAKNDGGSETDTAGKKGETPTTSASTSSESSTSTSAKPAAKASKDQS
jgi:putative FmdB family regulatory protein